MRLLVVGVGFMGEMYVSLLREFGEVWAVDPDGRRRARALELGAKRAFPTLDDALWEGRPDAAVVATPDHLHLEPCVKLLSEGVPLLIEKPLATTLEDARAIAKAASEADVPVLVGHILRFDPRYVAVKKAVEGGRIGEPVHLYARRFNRAETARRVGSRVPLSLFLGVHDLDLMRWISGREATEVAALKTLRKNEGIAGEDSLACLIKFEGGAVGLYEACWALPDNFPSGIDARFEVVGTKGAAQVDILRQGASLFLEGREGVSFPDALHWPEVHGRIVGDLRLEVEHFLRCVRGEEEPLVTVEDGLRAVELALAAEKSALQGGKPVALL